MAKLDGSPVSDLPLEETVVGERSTEKDSHFLAPPLNRLRLAARTSLAVDLAPWPPEDAVEVCFDCPDCWHCDCVDSPKGLEDLPLLEGGFLSLGGWEAPVP